MSGRVIPRDALAEVRRWELPSVDPNALPAAFAAPEPEAAAVADTPPAPEPAPDSAPRLDAAADDAPVDEVLALPLPALPLPALPLPALPTLEEIESIQREAHAEGYQGGFEQGHAEGREAGYREGLAQAGERTAAQAAALQAALAALAEPLAVLDARVEEELLQLVVAIARQLIRRELKTAPGEVVAVIRETVALLPVASRPVRVLLHPEDARLVRELGVLGDESQAWTLAEDPVLSRGGCYVEAAESRIDASVEARLNTAIATLFGGERGEDGGHG